MNNARIWVLGASDPEMTAIETLLRDYGEHVVHAIRADGQRVHPGNAYADGITANVGSDLLDAGGFLAVHYVVVECGVRSLYGCAPTVIIDHHRPGDAGYGRPPAEFLSASSIGQVIAELARLRGDDPEDALRSASTDVILCAAADHCLAAAYRGECPGVDPDALMRWRVSSRAAFQGRTEAEILADIDAARKRLREAVTRVEREWPMGGGVVEHHLPDAPYADLRGQPTVPELPEAACREGIPFLADVTERDGRRKCVLQAASADLVSHFMSGEIVAGLTDIYGDPARGIAGGYYA